MVTGTNQGRHEIGIKRNNLTKTMDCRAGFLLSEFHETEVEIRVCEIWALVDCHLKLSGGFFLVVAVASMKQRQVVADLSAVKVQTNGCVELFDGGGVLALAIKQAARIVVGGRVVGIEAEALIESGCCLIQAALQKVDGTQAAEGIGEVGLQERGLLKVVPGTWQIVSVQECVTKVIVRR